MSEAEAAEIFVDEARRFLELEMGLVRAEWAKKNGDGEGEGEGADEGENRGVTIDGVGISEGDGSCDLEASDVGNNGNGTLSDASFELRLSQSPETAANRPEGATPSDSSLFDEEDSSEETYATSVLSSHRNTTFENLTSFDAAIVREKPETGEHRDRKRSESPIRPNATKKIKLTQTVSSFEIVDVCSDRNLFRIFLEEISRLEEVSISVARSRTNEDHEGSGSGNVEGVSLNWGGDTVYYVAFESTRVERTEIDRFLRELFGKSRTVRIFGCREQLKAIGDGICFRCDFKDPKVADWILQPEGKEKNLQAMVEFSSYSLCVFINRLILRSWSIGVIWWNLWIWSAIAEEWEASEWICIAL